MELYRQGYEAQNAYSLSYTYLTEAVFGAEILSYAYGFVGLKAMMADADKNKEKIDATVARLKGGVEGHFKDYHKPIDDAALVNFEGLKSVSDYIIALVEALDKNSKKVL